MPSPTKISIIQKFKTKLKLFFQQRATWFRERYHKWQARKDKRNREKEVQGVGPNRFKLWGLWVFEALVAGLGINFVLWQLAGFQITVFKVLAWGVVYYFVTAEVPQFFHDCFRGVHK